LGGKSIVFGIFSVCFNYTLLEVWYLPFFGIRYTRSCGGAF